MQKISICLPVFFLAAVLPGSADVVYGGTDPANVGPPGGAILDLAGQPLPTVWTQYSVNFTAAVAASDITFLFRNDPGFTGFDDVSVTTGGGPNLIQNPGFESNTGNPPTNWTYDNVYGAPFSGVVSAACNGLAPYPNSGSNAWCDGATQAYDAIDQIIPTTIGDIYTISFWQNQITIESGVNPTVYQQLSTNGCIDTSDCGTGTQGNGIDTLVYVGSTIPTPTPEPSYLPLLGLGLLVAIPVLRRRFRLSAGVD